MQNTAIILSFPELTGIVDSWRMNTVDVARRGVPPHITLLYPWKASIDDSDIEAVVTVCQGTHPFSVEFDKLKYFDSGTVYLSLAKDQAVLNLSRKIWARFPDTPPYGGLYTDPIPHLTVAQIAVDEQETTIIKNRYAAVVDDIGSHLPLSFKVNEISIFEENTQGQWREMTTVSLH